MKTSVIRGRAETAMAVVTVLVLGVLAFNGAAQSGSQGAAPVNIADPDDPTLRAGVTPDKALQVTGAVTLTGTSTVLPVQVANFPATQNVHVTGGLLGPVAQILQLNFNLEPSNEETKTFAALNATSITTSTAGPGGPDEVRVYYLSPLTGTQLHPLFDDDDGERRNQFFSFSYPIPMNGIFFQCFNESFNCSLRISIAGF